MTAVLSSAASLSNGSLNGDNVFHASNLSLDSQHSLGGNDGMRFRFNICSGTVPLTQVDYRGRYYHIE
jgi:hypothetical protein